jgi:addiction module HigA family antidote
MSKPIDRLNPVHPGDVLRDDFMKPMNLSAYAVAKAIGTTPIAISQICRAKRGVSAEMALKLGRLFNVSPELWIGIQAGYDLEIARLHSGQRIERDVHPLADLGSLKAIGAKGEKMIRSPTIRIYAVAGNGSHKT